MHAHAWEWPAFILVVMAVLATDLGIFNRSARVVRFREALAWSLFCLLLTLVFAAVVARSRGHQDALEFLTGYLIELSLSLDNVFAIAAIFAFFGVAQEQQHRVLFCGVLGALVMRGFLIGLGAALIQTFHWVLLVLGAFLLFTGFKWALSKPQPMHPEKNWILRVARKILPISAALDGQKLWTKLDGRLALTPLALVLLVVEATDLVFAFDSIPAVFAVTQKPFIVFTSNIFAVLGMRSLYFVLARAMRSFRFLRIGIAIVLIAIGAKMIAARWYPISTSVSLCAIAAIIAGSIVASVFSAAETRMGKR
jgi:tellurite resistance protein TerC